MQQQREHLVPSALHKSSGSDDHCGREGGFWSRASLGHPDPRMEYVAWGQWGWAGNLPSRKLGCCYWKWKGSLRRDETHVSDLISDLMTQNRSAPRYAEVGRMELSLVSWNIPWENGGQVFSMHLSCCSHPREFVSWCSLLSLSFWGHHTLGICVFSPPNPGP